MEIANSTALVSGANRGLGRVLAGRCSNAASPVSTPVRETTKRATDVNLLINNAGAAAFAPPLSADPTGVEREMATNFGGTYAMIRAWAPLIEANGGGAIVDVLSTAGLTGIPAFAGYSASKASPTP